VADGVLRDFRKPLHFNWGEGVLLAGMAQSYELTGDERYLEFVRRFADYWQQQGVTAHISKCGRGCACLWGPGLALAMLYENTQDQRHLAVAEQVADFIMTGAVRTRDGGLSHSCPEAELWVDTLAFSCPLLSCLARLTEHQEYGEEAVRQLNIYAEHLQDADTGLYYHIWSQRSGRRMGEFWCRGNGWVAMSYAYVLSNQRMWTTPGEIAKDAFERHLAGLVRLQDDRAGLWHTIIDDPQTYLETSGSAMILYAMIEAKRNRLVDLPLEQPIVKAWRGLEKRVDEHGRVVGVSAGAPGPLRSDYLGEPGTYPWGTGAFLLAACVYAENCPDS